MTAVVYVVFLWQIREMCAISTRFSYLLLRVSLIVLSFSTESASSFVSVVVLSVFVANLSVG